MNKIIKTFDAFILASYTSYVILHLAIAFSLINVDVKLRGCAGIIFGTLFGIRMFIKERPFYVRRKAQWPLHHIVFIIAIMPIALGIHDLTGQLRIALFFCTLSFLCLSIFLKKKK